MTYYDVKIGKKIREGLLCLLCWKQELRIGQLIYEKSRFQVPLGMLWLDGEDADRPENLAAKEVSISWAVMVWY